MATEKAEDYKFGVAELADYLGIEEASVRIKLRNANVKKAPTGRYGWKTKDEMKTLGDKLKAAKPAAKKDAPKPAAKADAKKSDAKKAPAKDAKKKAA